MFLVVRQGSYLINIVIYIIMYIFYGVITYIFQLSQCPSAVNTFETYISYTCDVMILQQI